MNLPTEIFGEVVVVHTPEELGEDQADGLEAFLTSQERVNVVLAPLDASGSVTEALPVPDVLLLAVKEVEAPAAEEGTPAPEPTVVEKLQEALADVEES